MPHTSHQAAPSPLGERLAEQIKTNGGSLSFAEFMHSSLYTPGLGYYRNPLAKLGVSGDFTTAPELSPLFGASIANYCAKLFAECQSPSLCEFGPGTGKLALAVITQLAHIGADFEDYYLIDVSANLLERARETLHAELPSELFTKVVFLEELPTQFEGVILANEVLDAMPVNLFHIKDHHAFERSVAIEDGAFTWCDTPITNKTLLAEVIRLQQDYALDNYISEINLFATPWLNALMNMLTRGAIVLIDYGFSEKEYYHPDRNSGTLMCHYQHRAHPDPFFRPGEQDITSHVNFTALARAAMAQDGELLGFSTQADFLLGNGLLDCLNEQATDDTSRLTLNQQVMKLTYPHEMGELFKVLVIGKALEQTFHDCAIRDSRHKL